MKREDLFEAIGAIDEELLERSENRLDVSPKRTVWRITLAAAIIVSLAMSVYAVPALRNAIFGGKSELGISGKATVEKLQQSGDSGVIYATDVYQIWLETTLEKTVPIRIETHYMPALDGEWKQAVGYEEAHGFKYKAIWDNYERMDVIQYQQIPGCWYSEDQPIDSLTLPWDAPLTTNTIMLGDVQAFEVSMPAYSDGVMTMKGFRSVYWTDGYYIFNLQVPYDFTDAEILTIMESMIIADDITSYLID